MNRVALITGVGPGLGAALARRFARGGFAVALVARTPDFIGELAQEISSSGQRALAITADVSQANEISAAVAQTRSELGPIGVLIHNASGGAGGEMLDLSAEKFEQAWRVTALGAFLLAKETAPEMIRDDGGVMLFTGATSSVRGGGWLAFSSAKFALRGLVQSLARDLWPKGVHVAHVLVDGIIRAEEDAETEGGRTLLEPDEMADAYWFLANQPRSAWTLELDLRPNGEEFFV